MTNSQSGCLLWAVLGLAGALLFIALDHGCIVIPALQSETAPTHKPVKPSRPDAGVRYY